MNELLPHAAGLTQEEVEFVYNTEVLGLPAKKAAAMAHMPPARILAPHVMQARETVKRELRGVLQITKEDVVHGYRDAIEQAKRLDEPMTALVGWEKIAKMLGYDAPQKVELNIKATVDVLSQQVRSLDDATLVRMLGADDVIDGEFYDVGRTAG
jgi:hypothetical protein